MYFHVVATACVCVIVVAVAGGWRICRAGRGRSVGLTPYDTRSANGTRRRLPVTTANTVATKTGDGAQCYIIVYTSYGPRDRSPDCTPNNAVRRSRLVAHSCALGLVYAHTMLTIIQITQKKKKKNGSSQKKIRFFNRGLCTTNAHI